jgi:NADH-quinone oxidoreductase subunit L
MAGVFVTAFYSFRMYFLVFHGEERFGKGHAPSSLITIMVTTMTRRLRTIITMVWRRAEAARDAVGGDPAAGAAGHSLGDHRLYRDRPMVFGDYFKGVIFVDAKRIRPWSTCASTSTALRHGHPRADDAPFLAGVVGVVLSWFFYMKRPDIPAAISAVSRRSIRCSKTSTTSTSSTKWSFAGGARLLGKGLWKGGDVA